MARERRIWKRRAVQQRWPFRVSYAHDISHSCLLHPHPYCDAHESLAEAALHYILLCEMERPFGTRALSGLPFTHAHALCFFTLSSGWQRSLLIVPDLNKAPRVSELRAGKFCFHLLTSIWGALGWGGGCHFVTLRQMRDGFQPERLRWGDGSLTYQVLFLLFWAVCDACMSHSV